VEATLEFTPGDNSVPVREYEIYRRAADPGDQDTVTVNQSTDVAF